MAEPGPQMLEMFDLECRLGEIDQYAAWFSSPYAGSLGRRVAFAGLCEELRRPDPA